MSEFTYPDMKAIQVPPVNSKTEVVYPVHLRHGLVERKGPKKAIKHLEVDIKKRKEEVLHTIFPSIAHI